MAALLALPVSAETLKIGGTGSSASLVERLFEEFRKQVPDAELFQPTPPLGSGGALKALAGGRIDVAFAGRPLKPEEAAQELVQRAGPAAAALEATADLLDAGYNARPDLVHDHIRVAFQQAHHSRDCGNALALRRRGEEFGEPAAE